ncbi:DUF4920 domain-containing protein [Pseudofulvibacter geojedonensis]|uniref:DUF4920 domain-containing protein n=1 Tax=Pseudofulvibacter geojedonensis TaxID=1123758 RepID=A0ABW3I2B9_9FLAO
MKRVLVLLVLSIVLIGCKKEKPVEKELKEEKEVVEKKVDSIQYFGEKFEVTKLLTNTEMLESYKKMKIGDSTLVTFKAKINQVCKKKGCWMTLALADETEAMVKFKDYGFFMPLDCDGKIVTVNGYAFVNEVPVDELKHYAEDAGKSKEEIEKITAPEKTFSFMATGAMLD